MNTKTKELCIKGILIALTLVSTAAFQIPVPATNGYIHLGDGVIFISAIMFGRSYGLTAGGLGSALADILTGYGHWAPFTLVIKGLMGFVPGVISDYKKTGEFFTLRNALALLSGIIIMVAGYFLSGALLKGSFAVSATSIPSNIVQGIGGAVAYYIIGFALHHSGAINSKE